MMINLCQGLFHKLSVESVDLLATTLEAEGASIAEALDSPLSTAFAALPEHILGLFRSAAFRARCANVRGETACLLCARKEEFVWWLSIGDCLIYLLHPDLARLGQYALNQRSFFEWIGRTNTFALPVPSYASGIRELRQGWNSIVLITDGLLEHGTRVFADPQTFYTRRAFPNLLGTG